MRYAKPIFGIVLMMSACAMIPAIGHAQDDVDQKETAAKAADQVPSQDPVDDEPEPLTIGSPAPKLDIEHWVQDGGGHFAKVSEFEAGKVYIVEFWATWCGPCIASMPHIAEVQETYADRGVQVVSVTREDVETVEQFLEREVRGSRQPQGDADEEDTKPTTYRDLTSVYCLTADPDGSTSRDYMQAASQNGIPCAFIVGKDAKIEWIGHPMAMDEPLEQVVSDSWDRDAFAAEFSAKQAVDRVLSQVSRKMRSRDTKGAVAILDDYLANGKSESQKERFAVIKLQVLASDNSLASEAGEYAVELLNNENVKAQGIAQVAFTVYQMAKMGRMDNEDVLRAALTASTEALEDAGPNRAFMLDAISHLHHQLGELPAALETQREAIKAAPAQIRPRLTPFLEQLESELEAKNASDSSDEGTEK